MSRKHFRAIAAAIGQATYLDLDAKLRLGRTLGFEFKMINRRFDMDRFLYAIESEHNGHLQPIEH